MTPIDFILLALTIINFIWIFYLNLSVVTLTREVDWLMEENNAPRR
jgi:hypothetical protein